MLNVNRSFAALDGRWFYEREVSGQAHGTGMAVFSRMSPLRYAYAEQGELLLSTGARVRGTRDYLYSLETPSLAIYFADGPNAGQPFQRLERFEQITGGLRASARHQCGDDLYEGVYIFGGNDMTIVQSVIGPRKDYTIATHYRRG